MSRVTNADGSNDDASRERTDESHRDGVSSPGTLGTAVMRALGQDILFTVVPLVVLVSLYLLFSVLGFSFDQAGVASLTPDILFATIVLGGIAVSRSGSGAGQETDTELVGHDDLQPAAQQNRRQAATGFWSRLLLIFYLICIIVLAVGILMSRQLLANSDIGRGQAARQSAVSADHATQAMPEASNKAPNNVPGKQADDGQRPTNAMLLISLVLLGASLVLVTWTQYRGLTRGSEQLPADPRLAARRLCGRAKRLRRQLRVLEEQAAAARAMVPHPPPDEVDEEFVSLRSELSNLGVTCSQFKASVADASMPVATANR